MNSAILDLADILNRALDRAAQNLTIGKLLVRLGLDPSQLTLDAVFYRLLEVVLANINVASMCALVGAGFYAATLMMRTMVPLRIFGIISISFFIAYGALAGAVSSVFMYLLLLPINSLRLFQMFGLVKKARIAAQGDLSMDWLKPFMGRRKFGKGSVLFRKGQVANEMFLTVTGKFLVKEIGVELPPGRLMGELGFLTPDNKRTATVECIEAGDVMTITYDRLLEVYFQNAEFGYFFLRLASNRLLQNIARLEGIVEQNKVKLQAAAAGGTLDATAPDTTAPSQPSDSHYSGGKSEPTMAKETTGPVEPGKDASIEAKKTTSPDAVETHPEDRRASAVKLVKRFSLLSGAAGLIPVPFVDLAAVSGVQIRMLRRLSQVYSVPFSENRGKALIASLVGSMIPVSSAIGAASIIKSVPIVGTAIGAIATPTLSAGATYAIGMVFTQHFTSGGTLLDFNPPDYREFVKTQKELWNTRRKTPKTDSHSSA